MGWLLQQERQTLSAAFQDFQLRAYVGPPREHVIHGILQQDTPLQGTSAITKLTATVNSDATSIAVESTSAFPASGAFFIDTEFIEYDSKTATTFTGLTRTNATSHTSGTPVYQFAEVTDRVSDISLSGSIDAHEWTASISGDEYDHRLFQPDRSVYVETRYYPQYGSPGPIVGGGFGSVGIQVLELFTLKDADDNTVSPHGMTWTRNGQLWVVTDDDLILQVHPISGEVITTLTPSEAITDMEGIASSPGVSDDFLWIAWSNPLVPKIAALDRFTGQLMTSWITPNIQASGITWDGTALWVCDLNMLYLVRYDMTGTILKTLSSPTGTPDGIAYWDGDLFVLGGSRLYRVDDDTGEVITIYELPISNPQGLAISALGGRIGDATTNKVYELRLPAKVGRNDTSTADWTGWQPFYFGYIERGSIRANYLDKTWNLNCRSTWMYLGEKDADGRNLAPQNIAAHKPTRCSSVLSDPAAEIANGEYLSAPGEGVGCGNAVDDDMTTVWISQDVPYMTEGPDPTPEPVYGCIKYNAQTTLTQSVGAGGTQIFVADHEDFPSTGWIVLNPGGGTQEVFYYQLKETTAADHFKNFYTDATLSTPYTIQNSHSIGTVVSWNFADGTPAPCGKEAPQIFDGSTTAGRYCTADVNIVPVQVPLWPGEDTGIDGNRARRLIFTEIYKPRLGLRRETAWWIEMRNMSDINPSSLIGRNEWSPWGVYQGFLVIRGYTADDELKVVNVPLSILIDQYTVVGPWTDPSGRSDSYATCEKQWLVIVGDRSEFGRWWSVPSGVTVVELRYIPDSFPNSDGNPIFLDFNRGELKFYSMNEVPGGLGPVGNHLVRDIGPTDTSIRVHTIQNFNKDDDQIGFGMIVHTTRTVGGELISRPYEWITWTGITNVDGSPVDPGGTSNGVLTGVTRGVEGTKAREWSGRGFPADTSSARVVNFYKMSANNSIENPRTSFGDKSFKLSDWVDFSGTRDVPQRMPRVAAGQSYARLAERAPGWAWINKKVPQPGTKLRTGRNEWLSVDLEEISPPTLESQIEGAVAVVGLTGDISNLLNTGVVLVDQELIKYESIDRGTSAVAPTVTATLNSITRGYDGTTIADHPKGAQVWQYIDRGALSEHLVSGVSWHRKTDAPDGIPTHYDIWMTWRSSPRYPDQEDWENDWQLIWSVSGNTQRARGHFIQEFADLDSGADSTSPPGTLNYYRARHVMMVIKQTNSGRAKLNELKVYSTNPRVNLLAGGLSEEEGEDEDVNDMQNTIAVLFDYLVRGFGMSPDEIVIIGTGVNFYELPIASGSYQSIIAALAESTGYRVWFNRWNQLWFVPNPATRRSMPIMTDLDDSLIRGDLEIISQPSGHVSQVIVYFRDELSDETFEVRYPEEPRGSGNILKLDGIVVASTEEAKEIAQQMYQDANGQWEVVARFGIGHHFVLGHRYTVTYADWEGSDTYFQGANFIIGSISMNLTSGPERVWETEVGLEEYHVAV